MHAGHESKARRGELFKRLPVGFALDLSGKVVLHPDQRICEAIRLVFLKFRERWSIRQTFLWFRDHDIELPANPIRGTRLAWKVPTQALVREILVNPFYAGAYVWGRRPMETVLVDGHLKKRQTALRPAENCRVFIRDHHEGYIDWAIYEENQRILRRNSVNWQGDESMAAIRAGQGCWLGFFVVDTVAASYRCVTGEVVAPTRAICARVNSMTLDGIASGSAVRPLTASLAKKC